MVNKKFDMNKYKKYLKFHALGVSIVLVLITIALGVSSFIAFLKGTEALALLEDGNPYTATCGPVSEEMPLSGEEPINEDTLIAEKALAFDGCDAQFMEAEIIYNINSESVTSRIYITVIILLAATVLSFAIDIAYFSILRINTASLYRDELEK